MSKLIAEWDNDFYFKAGDEIEYRVRSQYLDFVAKNLRTGQEFITTKLPSANAPIYK